MAAVARELLLSWVADHESEPDTLEFLDAIAAQLREDLS
jgi:hypothetical protein